MPAKPKSILSVAKSVALMNMRRKQLDHVELVRRLNAVGETRRAALLHGNVHQDAQRMQGELRAWLLSTSYAGDELERGSCRWSPET